EADAFARWAGKRLPTEAEWEYAPSWGPDAHKRRYPWGDGDPTPELANLGQLQLGPRPANSAGLSAWGCSQLIGDVWEWTASDFQHGDIATVNPDGYGIGWYDEEGCPQRHRRAEPIWEDTELADRARLVTTTAAIAAVRLASPGSPVELASNAPLLADRWL